LETILASQAIKPELQYSSAQEEQRRRIIQRPQSAAERTTTNQPTVQVTRVQHTDLNRAKANAKNFGVIRKAK